MCVCVSVCVCVCESVCMCVCDSQANGAKNLRGQEYQCRQGVSVCLFVRVCVNVSHTGEVPEVDRRGLRRHVCVCACVFVFVCV